MPRYWWVNHNLTAREEIGGQYLWSPKVEINGARSRFYDNMRRADPGDLVLSYSAQAIRFVGRVADYAYTAPKPAEFGAKGSYWSDQGWLLPVFWTELSPPVRPKEIAARLAPLLPKKYSPFNAEKGSGNQKAYLAEISPEAFTAIVGLAAFDAFQLQVGGTNSLAFEVVSELIDDAVERVVAADLSLDKTTRDSVIQARRGQGVFRRSVEALEPSCRLTGITNPALLTASHIKPWRSCTTTSERLDGMNGLMLTPDADHLFDRGFISFENDGAVLVSPRVPKDDLRRLGFEQLAWTRFGVAEAPAIWRTADFRERQRAYLDYHRRQVFLAAA